MRIAQPVEALLVAHGAGDVVAQVYGAECGQGGFYRIKHGGNGIGMHVL